jgi:hypothetical protein
VSAVTDDLATRRFLGRLIKEFLAAVGLLSATAGLIDALFPDTFTAHGTRWALLGLTIAAAYGVLRSWPRPIEHSYSAPKTTIRIVNGDLLAEAGHIVVGACDTFDTKVPNIISRTSLQGQALARLYGGDDERLDADLAHALADASTVASIQKEGKTERYEIGAVAPVPNGPRRIFFLAYTAMNERNEARGTSDGIWRSLLCLWEAVSAYTNGEPIAVPVIGGGQARISQVLPAQDAIRFIAFSFMLASRHEKVCDELRIIVDPATYAKLDRLELQAFLDSLEMY